MKGKKRKISLMSKHLLLLAFFSVMVNILLGVLLTRQSNNAIRKIMRSRMLDISNTAAALLDGDVLRELSPEENGTEAYQAVMDILTDFQEHIGLSYIYCIRDLGNGEFVFGLDPSENPGEYGAPVVYTDALYQASRGASAVDEVPYEDAWGIFYSAYSPVFDSSGRVAGIIAVDFSRDWYDAQTRVMTQMTIFVCTGSLLVGLVVAMLLIRRWKKRVRTINEQLNRLSAGVESLMLEVRNLAGDDISNSSDRGEAEAYDIDDLDSLTLRMTVMMSDLDVHINKVHDQALYDKTTGVLNKDCYLSTKKIMDDMAREGYAEFSILLYDLNELTEINRGNGHEYGDMALAVTAGVLTSVFGRDRVFRTGGEEFTVITETTSISDIQNSFSRVDFRMAAENAKESPYHRQLSLSMGYASFDPETDREYMDVFRRADQMKKENKMASAGVQGNA